MWGHRERIVVGKTIPAPEGTGGIEKGRPKNLT
jgi:hypothetical protein